MLQSNAKLFAGVAMYPAEMPPVDPALPDEQLFEAVVRDMALQWSSTGDHPHFLESMRRDGRVSRGPLGRIFLSGKGWSVSFYPEAFVQDHEAARVARDWIRLAELTDVESSWRFPEEAVP